MRTNFSIDQRLELLGRLIAIVAVIFSAVTYINTTFENRSIDREERSLLFSERFSAQGLDQQLTELKVATMRFRHNDLLNDSVTLPDHLFVYFAQQIFFGYDHVTDTHEKFTPFIYFFERVDRFFDELASCIGSNICDASIAHTNFGAIACYLLTDYHRLIEYYNKEYADGTLGQGIRRFVQSTNDNEC